MQTIDRRYWLLTVNNPENSFQTFCEKINCKWAIGQLEKGDKGTPHYQMVVYFPQRITNKHWTGFPCFAKAIPATDIPQVITYCTKDDTRIEGPFRFGKPPGKYSVPDSVKKTACFDQTYELATQGRLESIDKSHLIKYLRSIQEISRLGRKATGTTSPRGIWIYGKPGTGKSHFARNFLHEGWESIHPEVELSYYTKDQTTHWFCHYNYESVIIMDDLDSSGKHLAGPLKTWADQYPYSAEVKGGRVALCHLYFVVTSNYLPSDLWSDSILVEAISRRFRFIRFLGFREWIGWPNNPGLGKLPETDAEKDLNRFLVFD